MYKRQVQIVQSDVLRNSVDTTAAITNSPSACTGPVDAVVDLVAGAATHTAAGTAGDSDTDTFADDVAGTSADPAAGVVADISARAVTDPVDGVVADTAAIAVAASNTNDRDRCGNRTCGCIGAVVTPNTAADATRSTAAGRGIGGTMQRVPQSVW